MHEQTRVYGSLVVVVTTMNLHIHDSMKQMSCILVSVVFWAPHAVYIDSPCGPMYVYITNIFGPTKISHYTGLRVSRLAECRAHSVGLYTTFLWGIMQVYTYFLQLKLLFPLET